MVMFLPAVMASGGSGAVTAMDGVGGVGGAGDRPGLGSGGDFGNRSSSELDHGSGGGFVHGSGSEVIRCLTPHLIDRDSSVALSPDWRPQLYPHTHGFDVHDAPAGARALADTTASTESIEVHIHESESGRFRLIYTTEGPDSVWTAETGIGEPGVPDYIALAAQYADSSFRYQVEQLGYTDPLDNPRCAPATGPQIDILFGDLRTTNGQKIYGYFDAQTPSRFYINSTFADPAFLRNDDVDSIAGVPRGVPGALKVTIAHELKHAIQFATNCFAGNEINVQWLEMDATMMENVVFPNVNDYYNYIRGSAGIFGNPQTRFPRAYSHVTFMLYYHEEFGPDFWVDVWDLIGDEFLSGRNIPMLEAMERVIDERRNSQIANFGVTGSGSAVTAESTLKVAPASMSPIGTGTDPASSSAGTLPDLEQSLLRNYLWHLASGSRSLFSYGFSERQNYPAAQVFGSYDAIPDWPAAPATVPYHSARFFEFRADQMDAAGEVVLALFNSDLPIGLGFLGKTYNGEVLEFLVKAGGDKRQKLSFPVDWSHLDWLGLVAMNTTGGSPVNRLQLLAGEGPAIERIPYGNITRSGSLVMDDARWMLSHALNPVTLSPFDLFQADVSGNGSVTQLDASRVLMHLENGTPFPWDDNLDNLGPEWSRFESVGNGEDPPAAALWKAGTYAQTAGADSKTAPPDTVTAELILQGSEVFADQKLDILLRISGAPEQQGGNQPQWSSLILELEIDFPPEGGGMTPGDPISLEMIDLVPGNSDPVLSAWEYDQTLSTLRLAFASSGPLAAHHDPTGMLTLRIIPENEGHIHFRISDLKLDEYVYAVSHPGMDTLRVMGPVFADDPGEQDNVRPLTFALEQNYPNPFNPATGILFTLPESGHATLHVYDITGRRVATLVDGFLDRGEHRVQFDAGDAHGISSGVYLYRLTAAGGSLTRKMTVVK